jgi:hypothetical protein
MVFPGGGSVYTYSFAHIVRFQFRVDNFLFKSTEHYDAVPGMNRITNQQTTKKRIENCFAKEKSVYQFVTNHALSQKICDHLSRLPGSLILSAALPLPPHYAIFGKTKGVFSKVVLGYCIHTQYDNTSWAEQNHNRDFL